MDGRAWRYCVKFLCSISPQVNHTAYKTKADFMVETIYQHVFFFLAVREKFHSSQKFCLRIGPTVLDALKKKFMTFLTDVLDHFGT